MDALIEQRQADGELREPPRKVPLVIQDPATGKKSILISPYLVNQIGDLSRPASRELSASLVESILKERGCYRLAPSFALHVSCHCLSPSGPCGYCHVHVTQAC